METDPPCLETSDQVSWTSDEHGPSHVRSYECTFCKRGFSNAQALGGHMNLHRKDRVKLKQPSYEYDNKLDSDEKSLYSPIATKDRTSDLESTGERNCTIKWPWIIPRQEDGTESYFREAIQLPLFVETPLGSQDEKRVSGCKRHKEKRVQSTNGSDLELDLELRLGYKPCDAYSKAGTVEFF